MRHTVKLPQLSETMEEGTISLWYKAVGDRVEKKESLYQVETDKSVMDVESVDAGFVCALLVEAGAAVPVGAEIAVIADSMEEL
jgi:pyruvate/2-oxoglutarate dehydrogenase complex dihydrolipoamide acyltransferase (E2) component